MSSTALTGGSMRDRLEPHPQRARRRGRVVLAGVRGEARRQPNAAHPIGAQRIHGHGRGQRRVDAAGESQHDAAKPVLPHVVAKSEHHRAVDRLWPWEFRVRLPRRSLRRRRADRSVAAVAAFPGGEDQRLAPEGKHVRQRPTGIHDERSAVEDELVLAADLVDVGEREPRFGDSVARQVETLMKFVDLEWRAVRHEQQLRARPRPDVRRIPGTRRLRRPAARDGRRGNRPARAAGLV